MVSDSTERFLGNPEQGILFSMPLGRTTHECQQLLTVHLKA